MNKVKRLIKNRSFQMLLIIILASISAAPPIALKQLYIRDDIFYHMLRIEELSKNIMNGKIFPYMHTGALDGYGYGSAFFYPELTLIIPAILCIMGFKTITAINISVVTYNILTGIISYICFKAFLPDIFDKKEESELKWLSLIGAIAYIMFPYRLYDIFYREAFNEFVGMSFVPLALLSMYKIFFKKEFRYWKMLSISFSLSLLTHLGTTLLLGIIGIIFFLLNISIMLDKAFIKSISKAILCSILATSYFLFPMIEQMLSNEFLYTTLPKITDVKIYPNRTIDKKAIPIISGSLSQPVLILLNIGIIYVLMTISKSLSKKITDKKWVVLINSLLIYAYIFIMQTDIFPWKALMTVFPPIKNVQFPFRLFTMSGILFSLIVITPIPVIEKSNSILKGIIVLLVVCIPQIAITDNYLHLYSQDEKVLNMIDNTWFIGCGEYLPSKIEPTYKEYLQDRGNTIKIKYKDNNIEEIRRNSKESHLKYQIDNSKNQIESIELPLIYYKGYDIKDNQDNIEIKESENGFVEINNIPKDEINIEIYYKGTSIQYISNIITIAFLSLMLIYPKAKLNKKLV